MAIKTTLEQTDDFAPNYDRYIAQTNWYGPQMLFGLLYEYILPEENLLDLGIGTGLSSEPFKKAGLLIYGVDGSEEMIKICRNKAIPEDIRVADLIGFKSPYGVAVFDHAISNGVFHLIGELEAVFSEVSRSLRKDGCFGFTINEYKESNNEQFENSETKGIYCKPNEESGIIVYQHSASYIKHLVEEYGFRLLKHTEFLAYRDESSKREYYFSAFIIQKIG